jgi:SCY1-like protein 1
MAPVVREQTLKSVLTIISKLSDRTINGELLKHLAKTANDEQPGIRTNTTICLGKIAKHLGTASRAKVLIAAFTRSMRDPFVHARSASLMSLAATSEYFSDEDAAARIIPALSPLLLDKEKLVRDQASRTMDTYLQKVRKAASSMPDTVLPPQQTSEAPAARMGTPQPTGSQGWTGWAISSFTNKISTASGEMQTENGTAPVAKPPQSPAPDVRRPVTHSASSLHRQAVHSPPATSGTASPTPSSVAEAFFGDGNDDGVDTWGDMGDMDEGAAWDDGADGQPTKAPAPASAPARAVSAAPFDESEPDFAGWLAAQSQKKSGTKPLPKGLSKTATTAKTTNTIKKPESKTPLKTAKPVVAKKIDMAPKAAEDDDDADGWGDGW